MVLQPNFRGSSGFGKDFMYAGRGKWGKEMQDDVTDGVNYLIDQGYVDPDRINPKKMIRSALEAVERARSLDIAFVPFFNTFRGERSVEMRVNDMAVY